MLHIEPRTVLLAKMALALLGGMAAALVSGTMVLRVVDERARALPPLAGLRLTCDSPPVTERPRLVSWHLTAPAPAGGCLDRGVPAHDVALCTGCHARPVPRTEQAQAL